MPRTKKTTLVKTARIKTQLSPKDQERIEELTGGSAGKLSDALDQWEAERAALAELHDESQALVIYVSKFQEILASIKLLVSYLENESPLFMTPKMRKAIESYRAGEKDILPVLKEVKTFKIIKE